MNRRRVLPVLMAAVVPSLASCSVVVDFFGPRPDPVLVQLAAQEESVGNSAHADALWAEVARICGTQEDGSVPRSCEVDRAAAIKALETSPAPEPLAAAVPVESRPLIIAQAIDNAPAGATDAPSLPDRLSDAEQNQAKQLIQWENELLWGLDFALAYIDPGQTQWLHGLIDRHEKLLQELSSLVANPPAAAAGYQPEGLTLPTDAAGAQGFVDELLSRADAEWTFVTTQAPASEGASESSPKASPWLVWLIYNTAQLRTR